MRKSLIALALAAVLLLVGCGPTHIKTEAAAEDGLDVVVTVFPAYDLARAAGGDLVNVTLLLPPGAESHSYEPTPADILAVQECDLFIYLGGESDTWVETILSAIDLQGDAMRMVDCVELLDEAHVEGMQNAPGHDHEHETDCDDDSHGHDHEAEVTEDHPHEEHHEEHHGSATPGDMARVDMFYITEDMAYVPDNRTECEDSKVYISLPDLDCHDVVPFHHYITSDGKVWYLPAHHAHK